jgi:hypothetical protein
MNLDIRLPIGGMFGLFGVLLTLYGLFTHGDEMYDKHSLGMNINLAWGLVLLAFGILMLVFGIRNSITREARK